MLNKSKVFTKLLTVSIQSSLIFKSLPFINALITNNKTSNTSNSNSNAVPGKNQKSMTSSSLSSTVTSSVVSIIDEQANQDLINPQLTKVVYRIAKEVEEGRYKQPTVQNQNPSHNPVSSQQQSVSTSTKKLSQREKQRLFIEKEIEVKEPLVPINKDIAKPVKDVKAAKTPTSVTVDLGHLSNDQNQDIDNDAEWQISMRRGKQRGGRNLFNNRNNKESSPNSNNGSPSYNTNSAKIKETSPSRESVGPNDNGFKLHKTCWKAKAPESEAVQKKSQMKEGNFKGGGSQSEEVQKKLIQTSFIKDGVSSKRSSTSGNVPNMVGTTEEKKVKSEESISSLTQKLGKMKVSSSKNDDKVTPKAEKAQTTPKSALKACSKIQRSSEAVSSTSINIDAAFKVINNFPEVDRLQSEINQTNLLCQQSQSLATASSTVSSKDIDNENVLDTTVETDDQNINEDFDWQMVDVHTPNMGRTTGLEGAFYVYSEPGGV